VLEILNIRHRKQKEKKKKVGCVSKVHFFFETAATKATKQKLLAGRILMIAAKN
jgi:hypothetical protein